MGKRVLRTRLCDILGIEYPILSAGMGPTLIGEPNGAPVELVVPIVVRASTNQTTSTGGGAWRAARGRSRSGRAPLPRAAPPP